MDGYELDEADDSVRLLISEFDGQANLGVINKSRAEDLFAQLQAFLEESASSGIWTTVLGQSGQTRELYGIIEGKHAAKEGGARCI